MSEPQSDALVFFGATGGESNTVRFDSRHLCFFRAVLTMNRRDYHKLHKLSPAHAGIIPCTDDRDCVALAQRVYTRIAAVSGLAGLLVKVTKAG
jgi:hypothetical protein